MKLIDRAMLQAFVIYCFFQLLVGYMGGERSLLILLHGRPPKDAVFPFTLLRRELDLSDPYVFLFMKRGILREFDLPRTVCDLRMVDQNMCRSNPSSRSLP
jgi:hypothetical protein